MFVIECTNCHQRYRSPSKLGGTKFTCKKCGRSILLPTKSTEPKPQPISTATPDMPGETPTPAVASRGRYLLISAAVAGLMAIVAVTGYYVGRGSSPTNLSTSSNRQAWVHEELETHEAKQPVEDAAEVAADTDVVPSLEDQLADTQEKELVFEPADQTNAQKPAASNNIGDIAAAVSPSIVTLEVNRRGGSFLGSGFFVTRDNSYYVVTNYHVIEGAQQVQIVSSNGQESQCTGWLAIVPGKDIAILAATDGGEALELATDLPRQGDIVLAFGSPHGLRGTLSSGLVSAVRMGEQASKKYDPDTMFVQTDTPISQGNSGGPLIDLDKRVVGVNTYGHVGGQNLNFAVSATHVRQLLEHMDGIEKDWTKLPVPPPDPAVVAARRKTDQVRAQAKKVEEERKRRIAEARKQKTESDRKAAKERELDRMNLRMITLRNELSAVENEGLNLETARGRVMSEGAQVKLHGNQTGAQIAEANRRLSDIQIRIAWLPLSNTTERDRLNRERSNLLNRLARLQDKLSALRSRYYGLDLRARDLLVQINSKVNERDGLRADLQDVQDDYNQLKQDLELPPLEAP